MKLLNENLLAENIETIAKYDISHNKVFGSAMELVLCLVVTGLQEIHFFVWHL